MFCSVLNDILLQKNLFSYFCCAVIGSDCFASKVLITNQSKCPIYPTSEPYNQTLAVQLAHWSALAYVVPQNVGLYNLKRLISRQLDGEYKVRFILVLAAG